MRAVLLLGLFLAGCGSAPIEPARMTSIEQLFRKHFAPGTPPRIATSWYASDGGLWVCGQADAPPLLRSQQSTIRFINIGRDLYVEPHLVGLDAIGAQTAVESAAIFDSTWSTSCASSAPLFSRIAGLFTWPSIEDRPNTPLTNAAVDRLLTER